MKSIPLVLFDGICDLCNRTVDFLLKKDKKKQFRFVALQSEEGEKIRENFMLKKNSDSVILIAGERVFYESDAAIEIARRLPAPWKWAVVFKLIPVKMRNAVYRWIARNRYRWFGKRESCRIITPEN